MSDDQLPKPGDPFPFPGSIGPGPLTQAAIDQAKNLPENSLTAGVTTTDFKTADARVEVQKKWTNGWGVGAFISAKIAGATRPQGSAGVVVTKKLGLLGGLAGMNPMYKAMAASLARVLLIVFSLTGIELDNESLEKAIETAIIAGVAAWGVYQKFKVDRKLKKVAATGVNS